MFACLAVCTAGTAWAEAPTMNGNYTETATTPSGQTFNTSWTVNSCGDGCVYIKACSDGAYVLYATSSHLTWDPNTLAGTAEHTYLIPACGHPAGYSYTDQIQIKQSS